VKVEQRQEGEGKGVKDAFVISRQREGVYKQKKQTGNDRRILGTFAKGKLNEGLNPWLTVSVVGIFTQDL
jgi:hypothetical protein